MGAFFMGLLVAPAIMDGEGGSKADQELKVKGGEQFLDFTSVWYSLQKVSPLWVFICILQTGQDASDSMKEVGKDEKEGRGKGEKERGRRRLEGREGRRKGWRRAVHLGGEGTAHPLQPAFMELLNKK